MFDIVFFLNGPQLLNHWTGLMIEKVFNVIVAEYHNIYNKAITFEFDTNGDLLIYSKDHISEECFQKNFVYGNDVGNENALELLQKYCEAQHYQQEQQSYRKTPKIVIFKTGEEVLVFDLKNHEFGQDCCSKKDLFRKSDKFDFVYVHLPTIDVYTSEVPGNGANYFRKFIDFSENPPKFKVDFLPFQSTTNKIYKYKRFPSVETTIVNTADEQGVLIKVLRFPLGHLCSTFCAIPLMGGKSLFLVFFHKKAQLDEASRIWTMITSTTHLQDNIYIPVMFGSGISVEKKGVYKKKKEWRHIPISPTITKKRIKIMTKLPQSVFILDNGQMKYLCNELEHEKTSF